MSDSKIGINAQKYETWPAGMDILSVVDDWNHDPPKGAAHNRTMGHDGYKYLQPGSHVVEGNEDDEEQDGLTLDGQPESVQQAYAADPRCSLISQSAIEEYGSAAAALWLSDHRNELRRQWRPQFAQAAKAAGMVVHCSAEKWWERYQYDPAYIDLCDIVDFHIAAFEVVGKSQEELADWWAELQRIARGKPICISEVETDPNYEEAQLPTIPEAMRICVSLGAWGVFAWGDNQGYANVIEYPDILDKIRALKANPPAAQPLPTQGEPTMAAGEPSPETLQMQNGLDAQGEYDLAKALIAVMNGDKATAVSLMFDGPQSTFGQLNAINNQAFPVPARPNF